MLMKVTFSESELAAIDAAREQEPRATFVRRVVVECVEDEATPTPVIERSPVVEPEIRLPREEQPNGPREVELERRRKIAATHKDGCGCINCTEVGIHG